MITFTSVNGLLAVYMSKFLIYKYYVSVFFNFLSIFTSFLIYYLRNLKLQGVQIYTCRIWIKHEEKYVS